MHCWWTIDEKGDKMKLRLKYIKDAQDIQKERIVLRAIESCNIGVYAIAKSRNVDDNYIDAALPMIYWLPEKNVNQGDYIVLYSKNGHSSEKRNDDGSKSYFFYWGKDTPIFNPANHDCAIIFEINEFKSIDC